MSLQSWWEETSRLEAASNDCHERRKKKYPPFKKKEKKRKRPGCSGLPGPHPCASGAKLFQTGATTAQLRAVLNHNNRNRMNKSHQKKCQYRVFSCATFVSWESEKERRKEPLPGSQNGPKSPHEETNGSSQGSGGGDWRATHPAGAVSPLWPPFLHLPSGFYRSF